MHQGKGRAKPAPKGREGARREAKSFSAATHARNAKEDDGRRSLEVLSGSLQRLLTPIKQGVVGPVQRRASALFQSAMRRRGRKRPAPDATSPAPEYQPKRQKTQAERAPPGGQAFLHFLGTLIFTVIVLGCAAARWAIAPVYVLFLAFSIPWRTKKYRRLKWEFFMVDFCYFVNALAAVHLVGWPNSQALGALTHALADGPVAGAIIVWQTSWVFSSMEHFVSVGVHLLPGLALACNRLASGPRGVEGLVKLSKDVLAGTPWNEAVRMHPRMTVEQSTIPFGGQAVWWLFGAPLVFYCTWQLAYYILVQHVLIGKFMRDPELMTSFKWLTKKTGNPFVKLINRQRTTHGRVVAFGLLQLAYTVLSFLFALPLYYHPRALLVWQAVKAAAALWYGSIYQCRTIPEKVRRQAMTALKEEGAGVEEMVREAKQLLSNGASKRDSYGTRLRVEYALDRLDQARHFDRHDARGARHHQNHHHVPPHAQLPHDAGSYKSRTDPCPCCQRRSAPATPMRLSRDGDVTPPWHAERAPTPAVPGPRPLGKTGSSSGSGEHLAGANGVGSARKKAKKRARRGQDGDRSGSAAERAESAAAGGAAVAASPVTVPEETAWFAPPAALDGVDVAARGGVLSEGWRVGSDIAAGDASWHKVYGRKARRRFGTRLGGAPPLVR
ncbi:unnamed protein product [Pedinophyceae sp. YPF-701]|nr:unnamed protein product [Pedinophyceae sp. YPF-701]